MTLIALALVLASATIHATWNLLTKRLTGGAESVWLFTLVAALAYMPLAIFTIVSSDFLPGLRQSIVLIGTGLLQSAYFILLRRGYALGDLSVVYPLARGVGPLMATALAIILLGERPTWVTLTGAAVVSIGTILFVRRGRAAGTPQVLTYSLMTGLVIGCYTVLDGYAVRELAIPAIIMGWSADVGRLVWLSPVTLRRRAQMHATWRANRRVVILIGVLSSGSYLLVLYAMSIAPVSSVAPAREISIVMGTLFGMVILGESEGRRRLIAATVVALGVMLVAFG